MINTIVIVVDQPGSPGSGDDLWGGNEPKIEHGTEPRTEQRKRSLGSNRGAPDELGNGGLPGWILPLKRGGRTKRSPGRRLGGRPGMNEMSLPAEGQHQHIL